MDKSAHEVSITNISIKKENLDNDIKEFAETAMNELLGWYGYSSRDTSKPAMRSCRSLSESNSSNPESPKLTEGCGWCGKLVEENTSLCSATAVFCSEACFSQSRRATFKKSKTCDWCRHARHTVSYVDSQDGSSQLQFCSDKCLNQYKMFIFCKETRAHLEMHPHFPTENSSGSVLITPDLWLKNCKTPGSQSPSPSSTPPQEDNKPTQTSPLPLITVAHPSKLMAPLPESIKNRKQIKRSRKRCPATITTTAKPTGTDLPEDLCVRTLSADLDSAKSAIKDTRNFPEPTDDSNRNDDNEVLQNTRIPGSKCPNSQLYFSLQATTPQPQRPLDFILPPTVLVPYPLVLPLPIPIPIPIPIRNLPNEGNQKDESKFKDASNQTDTSAEETSSQDNNTEIDIENNEGGFSKPPRKRRRVLEKPKHIPKK